MEQLEDGLSQARDAVAMLLSSSSSSSSSSSTAAAAAAAKDANRLLREVERAVQYAQREAMGEPEARKAVILGRLQQVERAARELKGTVRRVSTHSDGGGMMMVGVVDRVGSKKMWCLGVCCLENREVLQPWPFRFNAPALLLE